MEQRRLGVNGPAVGAMALGCMSFTGVYGDTDEAESHKTLDVARDLGVTHLDTANVYGAGVSEQIIGSYLAKTKAEFVIASKAGIARGDGTGRRFNNEADYLRTELEGSLSRLGVDHIALYYIHRRDPSIPIEDVMGTLEVLRQEGKIGSIGFSEISPSSLRRAAAVGPVAAVQSEYSLWSRMPEMGMIDACTEVGAAFVPFSPVARGMFGVATPDPATFKDSDIRKNQPRFQPENFAKNVAYFDAFRGLSADLGVAPATLASAWILDQGDHLIPIPGTRYASHLSEHVAAVSFKMTDAVRGAIAEIMPRGFAHGDRYSDAQIVGVERYC